MKRPSWTLPVAALLSCISTAAVNMGGCGKNQSTAPSFATPPPPAVAANVVDDFEDGNLLMNINLAGASSPGGTQYAASAAPPTDPSGATVLQPVYQPPMPLGVWVASSWGGNSVNQPYLMQDGQGANGSRAYIRLFGNLVEPAPPVYAAYQLEGKLMNGAPYDALTPGFTGVSFYYKLGAADNCPYRRFAIALQQTLPKGDDSGDGSCGTDCYDHYGSSLDPAPAGNWVLKSYPFSALSQAFGAPVPGALMGNRKNFVKLVWQQGRNGSPGISRVDYCVDDVRFF